jgi:phage terminase Nu1 subunit (DNA packaging protein)
LNLYSICLILSVRSILETKLATQKELAEHLDLSPQSVTDLVRKGVFLINKGRSPVNIDACRIAYINFLRKAARYTKKDGSGDINEEKTKLTAAQARKAELEVEIMEGKLVPIQEVEEFLIERFSNARAKWLGVPSKIAHKVITVDTFAEAEREIKEGIYEGLNELANDGIPEKYRTSDREYQSSLDSTTETKD